MHRDGPRPLAERRCPALPSAGRRPALPSAVWPTANVSQVPVDDRVADEQPHQPAEGEERAEGDRRLAALVGALARDHDRAHDGPGQERHEQRGADRAAEEEAHHGRELDVAHPHAARVGERREQEEAAGGGRGDQVLGQLVDVHRRLDRDGRHRRGRQEPVGDDAVVEVDQRDRDEQGHEDEPEPRVAVGALDEDDARRTGRRSPPPPAGSARRSARRSCGSGRAAAATRAPARCRRA